MMKVITGKMFNTAFGKIIVYNEQSFLISNGERVNFDGITVTVKKVIAPTKPGEKWSVLVE